MNRQLLIAWMYDRKFALLGVVVFVVLSYLWVLPRLLPGGDPVLRMSAGPAQTRRHEVAEYLRTQAAENRLTLKISENAGSEECLEQLKRGELDVAIINSALVVPDDDNIMVLGATQLEAVHILVRPEIAEQGHLAKNIRGKRVNLGVRGSTEWLLSHEFLKFARIALPSARHAGDVIPTELSKSQLLDEAQAIQHAKPADKPALIAKLPDCLLILATMPSPVVQTLVEAADYRVVPMPATRAFLLDNLQERHSQIATIEREFLEPTAIPSNSYFALQGFPQSDCETVGVRLLIVAHKKVPAKAIRPLMKSVFEGEFARRIKPISPRDLATPYAIHPAAISFLDREKPLVIRDLLEWFSTGLSIFGAFSAGALSLYGLVGRKKKREVTDYYAEINKLELLARSSHSDAAQSLKPHELTQYLSDRLTKLRQELIEDICEGRIEGDHLITNILGLLADSRQTILRHERSLAATLPLIAPAPRSPVPLRRAG